MRFTTPTILLAVLGSALALPVADMTETIPESPEPPRYHTNMAAWKRLAEADPAAKNCTGAQCFELWKRKEFLTRPLTDGDEPLKREETQADPKTLILWKKDAESEEADPKTLILWKKDAEPEAEAGLSAWRRESEACTGAQCFKAWKERDAEPEPCVGAQCVKSWRRAADAEAEPAYAW